MAGNRRLAAAPALAEFPGSMQALLGIEPLVLHALRGLVSLPVVLDLILPLGFCLDRVRCGPLFRFCGPGGCFLEGFPCPSRVLPRGRASALVGRLRQGESELESMAYCPPVRGNPGLGVSSIITEGSIPAWAGEPALAQAEQDIDDGLSPRGRGNREVLFEVVTKVRSIPAWAGEPTRCST